MAKVNVEEITEELRATGEVGFTHVPVHCLQLRPDLIIRLEMCDIVSGAFMFAVRGEGLIVDAFDKYVGESAFRDIANVSWGKHLWTDEYTTSTRPNLASHGLTGEEVKRIEEAAMKFAPQLPVWQQGKE